MALTPRSSGTLIVAAFLIAWIYFGLLVWATSHPSIANYVYKMNSVLVMGILSALGAFFGFYAARSSMIRVLAVMGIIVPPVM